MEMTQKQFCLFFGPAAKQPDMLSKYENGDAGVPLLLLLLLARKGVNLNWMFTGQGSMFVEPAPIYIVEPGKEPSPEEVKWVRSIKKIFAEGSEDERLAVVAVLKAFERKEERGGHTRKSKS